MKLKVSFKICPVSSPCLCLSPTHTVHATKAQNMCKITCNTSATSNMHHVMYHMVQRVRSATNFELISHLWLVLFLAFLTRMVYLYYILCFRYTILAGNPRFHQLKQLNLPWSLLVGCLTSQQQASVSQRQICSDNFKCCHTEMKVADPTFYLTQSQYTDTEPTSPSADPITPGAWQGSHWSANF